MKTGLARITEVAANIAIVVVAVVVVAVLAKQYLWPRQPPKAPPGIAAGTKLSIADVDWAHNGATLIVALQKGCHFCSESAPFYQRLVNDTKDKTGVKIVAVLPQPFDDARQYLDSIKVPIADVKQEQLSTFGVKGTPTLILVDAHGVVTDSWVGRLPPERETEVITKLSKAIHS
jgi:Redoxin